MKKDTTERTNKNLPTNKEGYAEGETIEIITETKRKRIENKRIPELFKKQKGLIKAKQSIREFKEPILQFIRKDKKVEFYENVTEGTMEIELSDGNTRKYNFETNDLCYFEYAGKEFRGYIQYEDEARPYPRDPWIQVKLIETSVDKILTDMSKWKIEEEKVKLGKIWAYVGLAAVIVGGFILYKMLVQTPPTPGETTAIVNGTKYAIINGTTIPII